MKRLEYRTVCQHFGEVGHERHSYHRKSEKAAKQFVIDENHRSEMGKGHAYYEDDAPYQIQTREVSEWSDNAES